MCITRSRWIPRNSGTLISHALRSLSKCSSVFSLLKSRADISFYDVQSFRALFVSTFDVLGFFECAFGRVFDSDIFPCPYWFFRQEAPYSFHASYCYGDFSSALQILPLLEQVSKLCPEKAWQVMMSQSLEAGLGDSWKANLEITVSVQQRNYCTKLLKNECKTFVLAVPTSDSHKPLVFRKLNVFLLSMHA